jgi:hypothetical protein
MCSSRVLLALGISGGWIGHLHERQRRFAVGFKCAFVNLSRLGTAY